MRPGLGGASAEGPDDALAGRVADALRGLADLDDRPVREHAAVYEAVHAALQDRLAGSGR